MMVHMHPTAQCVFSSFPVCISLVIYLLALTAGEDGLSGSQPISDFHAYAVIKLIFHSPKKNLFLSHHALADHTAQVKSSFILKQISGFLFLLSCRGWQWPRLRDLRKSAALLP